MSKILTLSSFLFLISVIATGCSQPQTQDSLNKQSSNTPIRSTIEINTPIGFERVKCDTNDVGFFLRQLSFKEDKTVYLFNGEEKRNQDAQYAVLDIDIGKRDLQQCADAVMRLRAEFLFKQKLYDQIRFHFTSGDLATWQKYSEGYRPVINGNSVSWVKSADSDTSYSNYRKYMDLIFTYCGTASMSKELEMISINEIKPGDVLHVTGNPYGHAVTIMDVARDSLGRTAVILSQSYMPAQSIHILVNPNNSESSPWYILKENEPIRTPEWTFPATSKKRWKG